MAAVATQLGKQTMKLITALRPNQLFIHEDEIYQLIHNTSVICLALITAHTINHYSHPQRTILKRTTLVQLLPIQTIS